MGSGASRPVCVAPGAPGALVPSQKTLLLLDAAGFVGGDCKAFRDAFLRGCNNKTAGSAGSKTRRKSSATVTPGGPDVCSSAHLSRVTFVDLNKHGEQAPDQNSLNYF